MHTDLFGELQVLHLLLGASAYIIKKIIKTQLKLKLLYFLDKENKFNK